MIAEKMSLNVTSPEGVLDALRHAAQCYYQSASDLQSVWQDPSLKVWEQIADVLDGAATKVQKILMRDGYLP